MTLWIKLKGNDPDFLKIISVLLFKYDVLFSFEDLRLTNDLRILLNETLHSWTLQFDATVRMKSNWLSSSEFDENMIIRDEKHLLNFMKLLESDKI